MYSSAATSRLGRPRATSAAKRSRADTKALARSRNPAVPSRHSPGRSAPRADPRAGSARMSRSSAAARRARPVRWPDLPGPPEPLGDNGTAHAGLGFWQIGPGIARTVDRIRKRQLHNRIQVGSRGGSDDHRQPGADRGRFRRPRHDALRRRRRFRARGGRFGSDARGRVRQSAGVDRPGHLDRRLGPGGCHDRTLARRLRRSVLPVRARHPGMESAREVPRRRRGPLRDPHHASRAISEPRRRRVWQTHRCGRAGMPGVRPICT